MDEKYLQEHPEYLEKVRSMGRELLQEMRAKRVAERMGSAQAKKGRVSNKDGISSKSVRTEHAKKRA